MNPSEDEIKKLDEEFIKQYALEPQSLDDLVESRPRLEKIVKRKLCLEEVHSLCGGELLDNDTE